MSFCGYFNANHKVLNFVNSVIFAILFNFNGEMPEWSNGAVSKTAVLGNRDRGFESLSLRQI